MAKAKKGRVDSSKVLDALLKNKGRVRIPEIADLAGVIITRLGGIEAFAEQLVTEFENAPVGSLQRTKLLELVMRGLKRDDEKIDVEALDDAELQKLFAAQVAEFQGELEDDGAEEEGQAAGG